MLPHAKFVSMMPSFRAYSAACAKKNVFQNTNNNSTINFTQQSPNNKKTQNIIRHRLESNITMNGACYYSTLSGKKCIPCEGGVLPLDVEKSGQLLKELHADWKLVDDGKVFESLFCMLII
jgi:hypothetical protein